jgi:hypothetical protein
LKEAVHQDHLGEDLRDAARDVLRIEPIRSMPAMSVTRTPARIAHQEPGVGVLAHDRRDEHVAAADEMPGHALGVRGLVQKVELQRHELRHFVHQHAEVEVRARAGRGCRPGSRKFRMSSRDQARHLGILDLDRDVAAIVQAGADAPARATPTRSARRRRSRRISAIGTPSSRRRHSRMSTAGATAPCPAGAKDLDVLVRRMSARDPRNWQTLMGSPSSRVAMCRVASALRRCWRTRFASSPPRPSRRQTWMRL